MTTMPVEYLLVFGSAGLVVVVSVYITRSFWQAFRDMYEQKEFWHKKYQYERGLVEKYRKAMIDGKKFDA